MDHGRHEFTLEQGEFRKIAQIIRDETGIVLADHKRDLVYGRLAKRLRKLGLESFEAYCDMLDGPEGPEELRVMVNALTTNVTNFFREAHHFEFLGSEIVPEARRTGRLRLWSAACSTGEEPYSIAMTVRDALGQDTGVDAKLLATDIDTNVVETAKAGRYPIDRASSIPESLRRRFVGRADAQTMEMGPSLKSLITFKPLNLFHAWPMRGPFDAIFCRNVFIYFDNADKAKIVDRFADMLAPDGHLFIGHSESLFRLSDRFELVGRTIYRRIS